MNKITNDVESSDRILNVAVFVFAVILNLTLLVVFTKKIYMKKDLILFKHKSGTSLIKKCMLLTQVFNLTQSFIGLMMSILQKSNLTTDQAYFCSTFNLSFTFFHFLIKSLNFSIMFTIDYVWSKQKFVAFLHKNRFMYHAHRTVFVFIWTLVVIIPFKINADVVFFDEHNICYSKTLSFHKLIELIKMCSMVVVMVLLIATELYYLWCVKCIEDTYEKNSTKRKILHKIKLQVVLILKLFITMTFLLFVYLLLFIYNYIQKYDFKTNSELSVIECFMKDFAQTIFGNLLCLYLYFANTQSINVHKICNKVKATTRFQ